MKLAHFVRVTIYATDVDQLFQHSGVLRCVSARQGRRRQTRCSA